MALSIDMALAISRAQALINRHLAHPERQSPVRLPPYHRLYRRLWPNLQLICHRITLTGLQITLLLNLTFPMHLTPFTVEICCKRSLTEYLSHSLSHLQPTQSHPYCSMAFSGCFHKRALSKATHWVRFCFATRFNRYFYLCLLYTSPSPRDRQKSRMPSSA